jgi:endoglucanase
MQHMMGNYLCLEDEDMHHKERFFTTTLLILILGVLLSGCVRSDEPAAAAPSVEWTATLPPTVTPLPTSAPRLTYGGGVNLIGPDFGPELPGVYGETFIYPTTDEMDYFVGKGMRVFRLPFRWERLQSVQFAEFETAEQARLDKFVNDATRRGAYVIIDPHNGARYYGDIVGETEVPAAAFADLWSRLAERYRDNSLVIFALMNEPFNMPTELWVADANAAIQAIRATGAANLILVSGNHYTGAHSWGLDGYGTPNAIAMLAITDPGDNYAYEVHQYMDIDSSAGHETCVSSTIGSERMAFFTDWLYANNKRGFLTEFGSGTDDICLAALDDILTHLDENSDVYLGWTYWAAGPWWPADYTSMSLEPTDGMDRPQMAILGRHLP